MRRPRRTLVLKIYKERYPGLKVICPAGARSQVEQVVPVDATYSDALLDEDVKLFHLEGTKNTEGYLQVASNGKTTIVLNDCVNNLPKMGGFFGFLLAPTGQPAIPRITRWMMIKDKPAFRSHLEKIAATPNLTRIIVSHGKMMTENPGDILRTVASALS